ncbi:MAG: substrate-binding domain-containing protein [Chloroflexi bacterium]|nr:substrate-binding domain-containing protein [Chloroflexota bacterium]
MTASERLDQIVTFIDEHRFISVKDLSKLCDVSEMTIRRDLQRLDEEQRIQRTYGGATSLRSGAPSASSDEDWPTPLIQTEGSIVDKVDVLITSSVDPTYDSILLDRVEKRKIPIIAESLSIGREETVVSVDNYQAGAALGRWVGHYAHQQWNGQVFALDLSYRLSNTQARSQGFTAGLGEILPQAQIVLSINAQSQYQTAYDLTTDALTVHPNINVIFAINDTTAWGAIQACHDLGLDPDSILVVAFGLEGDTLKDALTSGEYCKVGLAMFPEIVGRVCVEAATAACGHVPLARQLLTPHVVLTSETLSTFYARDDAGWQIQWDAVKRELSIPLDIYETMQGKKLDFSKRIGLIIPFREHEWYENLTSSMQAHAASFKSELEVVDADRSLKGEMDLRRQEIAQMAAEQIQPGDVVLIDSGRVAVYLAEKLRKKSDFTVITNSIPVLNVLRGNPDITLMSTGGVLRHSTGCLVGPTAEAALRELRADKLFLIVTGVTLDFGLSHTDVAEVVTKQAMIRAAREVILLTDHTLFGQESVAQVAPTTAIHKLITDEALPASTRLELTQLGIEVIVARI